MSLHSPDRRPFAVLCGRVCLAALLLMAAAIGSSEAGYYTFTPIATSNTPVGSNVTGFTRLGFPTINDQGDVAFMGITDRWFFNPAIGFQYMEGVFVGDGGPLATIADTDTGSGYTGFGTSSAAMPSINNGGEVAFYANLDTGAKGIFRRSGATVTTIGDTSGSYGFGKLSRPEMAPSMNDSGVVAFDARFDNFVNVGVFRGSGGSPTLIADQNNSPLKGLDGPAITGDGTVAFFAWLDSPSTSNGYFTGPNPATDTLTGSSVPGIDRLYTTDRTAINDEGTLVYVARRSSTGGGALIKSSGNSHVVIADPATGPFTGIYASGPAINNHGDVVFRGWTVSTNGIYTGPDPVRHKVIEVGDLLFGQTLRSTNFGISPQAINDAGQIVFRGRLDNSVDVIVRADPLGGSLPVNPLLPDPGSPPGVFDFNLGLTDNGLGVVDPIFIDPDFAVGYDFKLVDAGDPNFTSVLLPEGIGDDLYDLWLWDGGAWTFDQVIAGGAAHSFGAGGVDRFRILGIEEAAMLDPADPLALVTGVTFAGGSTTVDMTMTPLVVPEPTTLVLALFAALFLSLVPEWRRRVTGA